MNKLLRKITPEIWQIIFLFLAWRVGLFIVASFGRFGLPHYPGIVFPQDLHPILSMWFPYDSDWFIRIAKEGYSFSPFSMAFFPFWPFLIWIFSKILFFVNIKIIALALANIFTLLACIVFYLLVKDEYDKTVAYRTVKYFLFFPMSLFLAAPYSEPIFILLVLLSFYFLRKNQFILSTLSAIAAAAARLVGSFLFIPLIIEAIKQKEIHRPWPKILFLLLVPLGLLAYMLYLKLTVNDFFGFLHAYQNPAWDKTTNLAAFSQLWQNIKTIITFHFLKGGQTINVFLTFGYLLLALILVINYKKIRLSYLVYSLLVMFIPLFSGSLTSINRYILPVFPFFIILGIYGRHRWFDEFITAVFLLLLGLFTAMFVNGYWIG